LSSIIFLGFLVRLKHLPECCLPGGVSWPIRQAAFMKAASMGMLGLKLAACYIVRWPQMCVFNACVRPQTAEGNSPTFRCLYQLFQRIVLLTSVGVIANLMKHTAIF
jgi:hypothetical protein